MYCTQQALALDKRPRSVRVEGNLLHRHREPGAKTPPPSLAPEEFRWRSRTLVERLSRRAVLRETDFVREFGPARSAK